MRKIVQRADDGIESVINAFHNLPIIAIVLGRIRTRREGSAERCFHQHVGVSDQGFEIRSQMFDVFVDKDFLAGELF